MSPNPTHDRFASKSFSWDHLLDGPKMLEYLELCKRAGTGPSGLISKCDRIITALTFVRLQKTAPDAVRRQEEIRTTIDRISRWKKPLRTERQKERVAQMVRREDDEDEEQEDSDDEEAIFKCARIWGDLERWTDRAEDGFELHNKDKVMATAAVAALLLFRSYQRPGAVMGATLEEYGKARQVDGVLVITVVAHKTAAQGPARLTIEDPKEQLLLDRYVTHIRPQIGGGLSLLRLPTPEGGSRRLDTLGPLFDLIEKRYKVKVRTATEVRKSVATRVAKQCSEVERRAVAKHLSHSAETSSRHYEETNTRKAAADVAKLLGKKKKQAKQKDERQTRREYSVEEKLAIEDFFRTQIDNDRHVSLEQCREFLSLHPTIDRRDKQIQDRVKTLRGQK